MSRRRALRSAAFAVLACGFSACNAFPDELRARLADGDGGAGGPRGDASGTVVAAELLVPDVGTHRGLALTADVVAWSTTDGASAGYRLRALDVRAARGTTPRDLVSRQCSDDGGDLATGYLASVGGRVASTLVACPGWFCAFERDGATRCSYGGGYGRLVADAAGVFAAGHEGRDVAAFSTAFVGNIEGEARLATPDLVDDGLAPLAASPSRAVWVERAGSGFRVVACPRALARCTKATVVPERAGVVSAVLATDAAVFVAFTDGLEGSLLRVEVPSGVETTVARSPLALGGLAAAGDALVWSQGGDVYRTPLAGPPEPRAIARVEGAVTHLAVAADRRALFALSSAGLSRADVSF